MAVSSRTKARWAEQWRDPEFERKLAAHVDARRADPLAFSQLRYWLGLEVWTREEGLLVLAGVEPGTVVLDPEAFLDSDAEWVNAMPFAEHPAFFQVPDPAGLKLEDMSGNEAAYEAYLQNQEARGATLGRHQQLHAGLMHKLEHSPSALGKPVGPLSQQHFPPVRFLAWAQSINFKPSWFDWAKERGLLPDELNPMAAPFFDAESSDYPELLAIAVRAWDHARSATGGTPKQRIERYLSERYSHLTESARSAIASVANWKKSGGRPRSNSR
jgi:hypothetical protein